jgi:hypothetical protein
MDQGRKMYRESFLVSVSVDLLLRLSQAISALSFALDRIEKAFEPVFETNPGVFS